MPIPAKRNVDAPAKVTDETDIKPNLSDAAAVEVASVASPARDLQDRLDAHFVTRHHPMTARFVTLLVVFTCLGTWVTGVGLYSTL
jgi:hypothetical protein